MILTLQASSSATSAVPPCNYMLCAEGKKVIWGIDKTCTKQCLYSITQHLKMKCLKLVSIAIMHTREQLHRCCLNPAALPSFRVFSQVQHWHGNYLSLVGWRWKSSGMRLKPMLLIKPPAPDNLLHLVICNCRKSCSHQYTGRRAGLSCLSMCGQYCVCALSVRYLDLIQT